MARYDPKQVHNAFQLPVCSSRSSFFKMTEQIMLIKTECGRSEMAYVEKCSYEVVHSIRESEFSRKCVSSAVPVSWAAVKQ